MFKYFRQKSKEKSLMKELAKDALTLELFKHVNENWHNVAILSSVSEEVTQNHLTEFFSIVEGITGSGNPIQELRKHICTYVLEYANYLTLVLTPEDKKVMFVKDSEFVSGELYEHLGEEGAKELTDKFKEYSFNYPKVSGDGLYEFANYYMAVLNFFMLGMDLVRIHFDDYNKVNTDKDWFWPFVIAMAEKSEYDHREKLGIPQILDQYSWLKRSLFIDQVLNEQNPLRAYEESLARLDKLDEEDALEELSILENNAAL